MKKQIFSTIIALATGLTVNAQTATNFTCNDCSGTQHDLFTELDAGKVIVLDWVMPCGACVGPSVTSYNMVTSYQSTHPSRVFFYMADDYANTVCTSLNAWATSNGIPQNAYSFRFSNPAINMLDYGSTGMPKIVVLGGTSHTVYYNANNSVNATALQNAINAALASTGINEQNSLFSEIQVNPNPSSNDAELKFGLSQAATVTVELYNLQGRKLQDVYLGKMAAGAHTLPVNCTKLASGTYLVKLDADGKLRYVNMLVTH